MISELVILTGLTPEYIEDNYTEYKYWFEAAMQGRKAVMSTPDKT